MPRVVKVNGKGGNPSYYFINGVRSDAWSDFDVLRILLGNELEEYWLSDDMYLEDPRDFEIMARMESAETLDEFQELVEQYPEMVEDL